MHRVFTDRLEAEFRSQEFTVDAVWVAGESCTAERKHRDSRYEGGKTIEVGEERVSV